MPRVQSSQSSSLRNRQRITNKYRLKIYKGDLDTEPYVADDDDEKSRSNLAVAGVDQEDANEHHLQAVLAETARRHQTPTQRPTRNDKKSTAPPPPTPAYIPTPDSTGVVANYAQSHRWKDPISYVCSSQTVEDAISGGLGDFTYYADERDNEFLEKNNEEARGEGTSAQGALSSFASRTSRSAKAKGKEPEQNPAVSMTIDQFELVMGLFEKVTHEKTEHLHLSLNAMEFPAFSEYQDVFAAPLKTSDFAAYLIPAWVPPPSTLVRIARAIYPHWRERRQEREGHRIMPSLNGDENDTLNESYVCFRRREVKSIRKTRAQVTSSEKLIRLQNEMESAARLTKLLLERETLKQADARAAQDVWLKRLAVVDLKRKFSALGDKSDEELFVDKERERPPKRQETMPVSATSTRASFGLKIKTPVDVVTPKPEPPMMRPQARSAMIQSTIDIELTRQKDHSWEESVSNPYQPRPAPFGARIFRHSPSGDHAIRVRRGRGGRVMLDRRSTVARTIVSTARSSLFESPSTDADEESADRLRERWRFDLDDTAAVGPEGADEQDRVLEDEYDPSYLTRSMRFLKEADERTLTTDTVLQFYSPDGSREIIQKGGFRLGAVPRPASRPVNVSVNATPMISQQNSANNSGGSLPSSLTGPTVNGTPISAQMKRLPQQLPSQVQPQAAIRISSNGGMRPPSVPSVQSSPPHSSPPHATSAPPILNGSMPRAPINVPHLEPQSQPSQIDAAHSGSLAMANGVGPGMGSSALNHVQTSQEPMMLQTQMGNAMHAVRANASSPARPMSSQSHPGQLGNLGMDSSPAGLGVGVGVQSNGPGYLQQNGYPSGMQQQYATNMSMQMHSLKAAFGPGASPNQDYLRQQQQIMANAARQGMNAGYMGINNNHSLNGNANAFQQMAMNNNANMNLKLPPGRHMPVGNWQQQMVQGRPNSVVNGMGHNAPMVNGMTNGMNHNGGMVNGMNGMVNGMDNAALAVAMNGHHASLSPSPGLRHASVPARTPSQNGSRNGMRPPMNGQMSMSPHMQHAHASPPMVAMGMGQSPPRGMTPMQMGSPGMQNGGFY